MAHSRVKMSRFSPKIGHVCGLGCYRFCRGDYKNVKFSTDLIEYIVKDILLIFYEMTTISERYGELKGVERTRETQILR